MLVLVSLVISNACARSVGFKSNLRNPPFSLTAEIDQSLELSEGYRYHDDLQAVAINLQQAL